MAATEHATTRSSSAAATTASSPPRTSAKAGLRTLVLERRERVGGAAETSELAPGARVPTLAHTVGRLRPSVVRDLDLRAPRAVARRARTSASSRRSPTAGRSRSGPTTARTVDGLRALVGRATPSAYAGLRPARPVARPVPRRDRRPDAARHQVARPRRRARRAAARADVPWPRQARRPDDPARPADGGRRLRRRGVRDRRAPGGDRLARRPVHARWGRGRRARPRSCSADSAGNDGGAAGQTVFAVGGPGALSRRARGGGPGGRRRDPHRRRGRRDHVARRRGRPASRSPPARRSRRATVVVRASTRSGR